MRDNNSVMFELADYGHAYAAMTNYLFSAAWSWMVGDDASAFIFNTLIVGV